jgi:DnaJ-class molecular chaperone
MTMTTKKYPCPYCDMGTATLNTDSYCQSSGHVNTHHKGECPECGGTGQTTDSPATIRIRDDAWDKALRGLF